MSIQQVYSMVRSAVVLSVLPLTFATVMPKTAQAASFNYTACNMDNFDTSNGPENSTPSQGLIDRITPDYDFGASTLCDRLSSPVIYFLDIAMKFLIIIINTLVALLLLIMSIFIILLFP